MVCPRASIGSTYECARTALARPAAAVRSILSFFFFFFFFPSSPSQLYLCYKSGVSSPFPFMFSLYLFEAYYYMIFFLHLLFFFFFFFFVLLLVFFLNFEKTDFSLKCIYNLPHAFVMANCTWPGGMAEALGSRASESQLVLCGPTNQTNPAVPCCISGDLCLSNSLCQYSGSVANSSTFYTAGCSDSSFPGGACARRCGTFFFRIQRN